MKTGAKWGNLMIWWEEHKHTRCTIIVQIAVPWTKHNRLTKVGVGARMASYYPGGAVLNLYSLHFFFTAVTIIISLSRKSSHCQLPWTCALNKNLIFTVLIAYFQEREEFVTLAVISVFLAYTGHAAADSRHWQRFWWWTM